MREIDTRRAAKIFIHVTGERIVERSLMRRRQLLRRGAVTLAPVGLGVGAGCAEKASVGEETPTAAKAQTPVHDDLPDLPVEDRRSVTERAIETAAEADVGDVEAFEAVVADGGPTVEKLTEREGKLELELVPSDAADRGVVADVGLVGGAYAALVRADDSFLRVSATLLDDRGKPMGSFQAVTAWARRYVAAEWSAKAYGEALLGTLQTKS